LIGDAGVTYFISGHQLRLQTSCTKYVATRSLTLRKPGNTACSYRAKDGIPKMLSAVAGAELVLLRSPALLKSEHPRETEIPLAVEPANKADPSKLDCAEE
jgi:hypothetical protein